MTQPTSANPLPLSYATPRSRARRWAYRIAAALALLAAVIAAWQLGPHAWRFAQIWYWERQCMNFDPPAVTVVYERLPPSSNKPATAPPYIDADDPRDSSVRFAKWLPNANASPHPVDVDREPICWVRFLNESSNVANDSIASAVVFCHQRTSPKGHVRLVTVEYSGWRMLDDDIALEMHPSVFAPARWESLRPAPQLWSNPVGRTLPGPARIFAGQPDPADASRFTIEYQWPDGVRGILDGYLRDDDNVDLTIRPGPGDVRSERERFFHRP